MEQLSQLLDCGLSRDQLQSALALLKLDVHPEALAAMINKLRDQRKA